MLVSTSDMPVETPDAVVVGTADESRLVIEQISATSVRVAVAIDSADAPETYEFRFDGASTLRPAPDGSIEVRDLLGNVAQTVAPPWALDADGKSVPTHFEVEGTKLTQIIEHRGRDYEYGIVADPEIRAYPGGATPTEIRWCKQSVKNLDMCRAADVLAKAAGDAARMRFPQDPPTDTRRDAYRHCAWSGMMTVRWGPSTALGFTSRHETGSGNSPRAARMDLHNNWMGRVYGNSSRGSYQTLHWHCLNQGIYGPAQLRWFGHGA